MPVGEIEMKLGIFIHIPWPGSDMVKSLPVRNELLRGMLAFDLIGFQIFDYARHFLIACTRLLGVQHAFKLGGILSIEAGKKSVQITSKHLCLPEEYAATAMENALNSYRLQYQQPDEPK